MLKNWMQKKIVTAKPYQEQAFELVNELVIEHREGKKIRLIDGRELIEFISCSYLGLDQDPRLTQSNLACSKNIGIAFHSARTRALPENYLTLEKLLYRIYCHGYPIIFQNVHMVHLGLLPLLGSGEMPSFPIQDAGIVFILDKKVHTSIQINRGLISQFGEVILTDLTDIVKTEYYCKEARKQNKTPIVISDSICSMRGVIDVRAIIKLIECYDGYAYFDDAHGTSVCGRNGCGYVLQSLDYRFHPRLLLATTLGKGFGTVGGILLVPTEEDAKLVKRFATTYIFSGPLAHGIVEAAIASSKIHLSEEIIILQKELQSNLNYFDSIINMNVINKEKTSPLRGILIGDEYKAITYAKQLQDRGFALTTAMYPVVPQGESMLRIAFSARHKKDDIERLCEAICCIRDELST